MNKETALYCIRILRGYGLCLGVIMRNRSMKGNGVEATGLQYEVDYNNNVIQQLSDIVHE